MALETGLRTLLLAQASITALAPAQTIAGSSIPAIFNEHPKRGVLLPYILIHQIDFDPYLHLGGTSGMASYEIDIDCYAVEHADAIALGAAVEAFLKDYSGSAGASDTINAVNWLSKRMDRVQEAQGRDVQQHILSLSFQIQAS